MDEATSWPYVNPDEAMYAPDIPNETQHPGWDIIQIDPETEPPFSESEPWGRMEGETEREFRWFCYYRSLGMGRKKSDVARHYEVSTAAVSSVVKKNDWDDRILAWDRYREREYTQKVIENVHAMAAHHAEIASRGILALSNAFEALIKRISQDPKKFEEEIGEMPIRQLFGLAQKSAQVIPNLMNAERLSRGMPTEITKNLTVEEHTVTIQTTDQLAEIVHALTGVISSPLQIDNPESDSDDDGWGEAETVEVVDPEDE